MQKLNFFLNFRLWNSTLIQFFPRVDLVRIASRGKIHIPSKISLQQDRISDDEFEVSF